MAIYPGVANACVVAPERKTDGLPKQDKTNRATGTLKLVIAAV